MTVHPNQADERLDRHIARLGGGSRGTRKPDVQRKRAADVARIGAVQHVEGSGSEPRSIINVPIKNSTSATANVKFTAAQIEASCPARLQEIGKEIEARFKKAQKQYQQAENHVIAIRALIDEARALCDEGGFKKFRERFCPQLGKSQAYVLHAIGTGRKTLAQHRTEQRDRKRKSRAKQKSSSPNSVTVTEIPRSDSPEAHVEDRGERKPRSSIARGDYTLFDFSARVMELVRIVNKRKAERFVWTRVSAHDLSDLGKFLTELAELKRSSDRAPTVSASDNTAASVQVSPSTCSQETGSSV
jgi:hypothetical protein